MRQSKREILQGVAGITKSKIVGNNTIEYFIGDTKYIRLHNTDILTFKNGSVVLNTGGWKTLTTKDRFNSFLPDGFRVSQSKSIWYLNDSIYYDGITIKNNAIVKLLLKDKKAEKLLKQIAAYCKKLKELKKLPEPSSGDCWYCSMQETKTGKPLGEITKNSDHLQYHLKEKYIHGSLILNALKWAGYAKPEFIWQMDVRDSIVNSVRRYLKRHLNIS